MGRSIGMKQLRWVQVRKERQERETIVEAGRKKRIAKPTSPKAEANAKVQAEIEAPTERIDGDDYQEGKRLRCMIKSIANVYNACDDTE